MDVFVRDKFMEILEGLFWSMVKITILTSVRCGFTDILLPYQRKKETDDSILSAQTKAFVVDKVISLGWFTHTVSSLEWPIVVHLAVMSERKVNHPLVSFY